MGKSLLTTCYRIREALNPGRPRPGLTPIANRPRFGCCSDRVCLGLRRTLIKLDLGINSFVILLEAPTVDPNLAFFTMAWLVVYQIKKLESMTHEVFSDMENKGLSDRQWSSGV